MADKTEETSVQRENFDSKESALPDSDISSSVEAKQTNEQMEASEDQSGACSSSTNSQSEFLPPKVDDSSSSATPCAAGAAGSLSFKVPNQSKVVTQKPRSDENKASSKTQVVEGQKTKLEDDQGNKIKTSKLPPKTDQTKQKASVAVKQKPKLSPAEQLKLNETPLAYLEPKWGGLCKQPYNFEIIKNGAVISSYDLTSKSFHVIGRLASCDHPMDHPSLSRHHAVIQYCALKNDRHDVGWYLYDLDSTHGTVVNKVKVKPRIYHRLRVGFITKFGGSSRLFLLQGPGDDQDTESELSISEMKEKKEKEALLKASEKLEEEKEEVEDTGCSWGMSEDTEEIDMDKNPFALTAEAKNEDLYIDDPKKALKGFFEREGYDLPEYEFVESSFGKHTCQVELPVDLLSTNEGQPIIAEATVSGKKKEAVVACALEACRIIDRHDLLRQSKHESRARKKKDWEAEDYYGSDEDTFLDRTGDIERKRKFRMKEYGHKENKAETYDSLMEQLTSIQSEISEVEKKLEQAKSEVDALESEGLDALDVYMTAIKSGTMDAKTRTAHKRKLLELRKEQMRLQRLVSIAKPSMPALQPRKPAVSAAQPKKLPMFGKMKGPSRGPSKSMMPPVLATKLPSSSSASTACTTVGSDEEEEEEEEMNKDVPMDSSSSKTENTSVHTTPSTESSSASPVKDSDDTKPETAIGTNTKREDLQTSVVTDKINDSSVKEVRTTLPADKTESVVSESGDVSRIVTVTTDTDGGSTVENIKSVVKTKKVGAPEDVKAAKRRKKEPIKAGSHDSLSQNYCDDDPDYATWVPPQDQTGDGKTHLNAKFGY